MILRVADAAQHVARRQVIGVDLQLGHGQFYGRDLVVLIVNGEVTGQPGGRRLAPQKPRAERMKCRNPGLPRRNASAQKQIRDAIAHFFCGFVGEGHRQNRFRGHAFGDQVRHAAGNRARLARARACENQNRAFLRFDSLALFRIQFFENCQHGSVVFKKSGTRHGSRP